MDLRIKSFKLHTVEKMSLVMGKFLALTAFIVLVGFAILLFSTALAIVVSKWVGSLALAFVIVGGLYLLFALLFMLLRESLFSNAMVKTFMGMFFPDDETNKEEDEDEDEE